MTEPNRRAAILMADDDPEDCELTRKALSAAAAEFDFQTVGNGEELLSYLRRRDTSPGARRPDLILLDLNMPVMDGRQALAEIKNDDDLRRIPIIVLTTSDADADVVRSYQLGANSYLTKPGTFQDLVRMIRQVEQYWFELVQLPAR